MNINFTDYQGPTGLVVATGKSVVPLESAEGVAALSQSAMLSSLGASDDAKVFQTQMAKSLKAAHAADAEASKGA